MARGLKQKAAAGMVWTALQKYSKMIIQFISGIILARLLMPHDYGCIGMLAIFMVMAEAFIDGGFGSALIQRKRPTQEDYSTVFFFNIGMSVLLYSVTMNPVKILVAGDLMPSENNYALFEEGNTEVLFGKELCQLFADADFSIVNLEGVLTKKDNN